MKRTFYNHAKVSFGFVSVVDLWSLLPILLLTFFEVFIRLRLREGQSDINPICDFDGAVVY